MIESISEETSKDVANPEVDGNTHFTIEIKVKSTAEFIEKIENTFQVWLPTYMGAPLGKLALFKKKKSKLVS